ncbi:Cytochrome P450 [Tripterygium wilfordii]|uniref:Cytochrome P450 n=1 Tax=Tripterygium wilfordii TaxID=458696 RepID=A0A7J7BV09_TRIWF|nr:Cytochrome P450 [Tripterygium wilfordii]
MSLLMEEYYLKYLRMGVIFILGGYVFVFWFLKRANELYYCYIPRLGFKQPWALPPGDMGWPIVGNMFSFFKAFRDSDEPHSFVNNLAQRVERIGESYSYTQVMEEEYYLKYLRMGVIFILGGYVFVFWFLKRANELYYCYIQRLGFKQPRPLPPGDMGWPIIGNMFSFLKAFRDSDEPHSFINNLAQRYVFFTLRVFFLKV